MLLIKEKYAPVKKIVPLEPQFYFISYMERDSFFRFRLAGVQNEVFMPQRT